MNVVKNLQKVFRYVGEKEYTNKQGQKSMKNFFVDAEKNSDNRERILKIDGFSGEKNGLYVIKFDYIEYWDKNERKWKSWLKPTGFTQYNK